MCGWGVKNTTIGKKNFIVRFISARLANEGNHNFNFRSNTKHFFYQSHGFDQGWWLCSFKKWHRKRPTAPELSPFETVRPDSVSRVYSYPEPLPPAPNPTVIILTWSTDRVLRREKWEHRSADPSPPGPSPSRETIALRQWRTPRRLKPCGAWRDETWEPIVSARTWPSTVEPQRMKKSGHGQLEEINITCVRC